MDLVTDEQLDVLDILPLFPTPGKDVPLVWSGHHHVPFGDQLEVGRRLAGKKHHLLAQRPELGLPVGVNDFSKVLQWGHINAPGKMGKRFVYVKLLRSNFFFKMTMFSGDTLQVYIFPRAHVVANKNTHNF